MTVPPSKNSSSQKMLVAIAWCLAWGDQLEPDPTFLNLRDALKNNRLAKAQAKLSPEAKAILQRVNLLQSISETSFRADYPETLEILQDRYPDLFAETASIGLVLGGATKIKQYVYESINLQEIRGASALLDRINLIDLKAFFDVKAKPVSTVRSWFQETFPQLADALIKELVIYSTGGNILAFCPAAYVHQLADAIEQCYTRETLTANSAAVGDTFKLPELRFGHLRKPWFRDYLNAPEHPIFKAYFDQPETEGLIPEIRCQKQFCDRKNFSELVTHLATRFNQRRSGNELAGRTQTRAYPPMFETHAYLSRDGSDRRSSTSRPNQDIPNNPKFSEASARKYFTGKKAKREETEQDWWKKAIEDWQIGEVESWVQKFRKALDNIPNHSYGSNLPTGTPLTQVTEARSLPEIGDASYPKGYVAYIYADGNNMGGYIQKSIKTPQAYQQFSQDIFDATEYAVYQAIDKHLKPHWYIPNSESEGRNKADLVHPFEILTIGGDDVLLIVPADKALAMAKTISEVFEDILKKKSENFLEGTTYISQKTYLSDQVHRYRSPNSDAKPEDEENQCELSMSAGVLITADNTPIYYAERLVSQLLKSAKRKAKTLRKEGYLGGTIDFLVLKSVTMISSNVDEFRAQGLTRDRPDQPTLKLYGAPYTLYELEGLLETVKKLHESHLPVSQIYQIRSLLEQGKKTAMLNYHYFRARLKEENRQILDTWFGNAWCWAKENSGTFAPWRCVGDRYYETIWRELVDLYAFIPDEHDRPVKSAEALSTQASLKSPAKSAATQRSPTPSRNRNRRRR